MKHYHKMAAVIACTLLFNFNLKAQVSILGNGLGAPGDYVGWNALQPFALTIQHLGGAPVQTIDFSTGGVNRMTKLNTGGRGYVGIGNGFLTPQNRLHLNEPGATPLPPG